MQGTTTQSFPNIKFNGYLSIGSCADISNVWTDEHDEYNRRFLRLYESALKGRCENQSFSDLQKIDK